jgi:hypothetical protein
LKLGIKMSSTASSSGSSAYRVQTWAIVHGLTSLLISHSYMPWPDRDTLTEHLLQRHCADWRR